MSDLRKEFEALLEIKEMLDSNEYLRWCEDSSRYINHRVFQDSETGFINGAWMEFQHQQKKIDAFVKIVHDVYMSDGNSSVEIVYDKIQELLK